MHPRHLIVLHACVAAAASFGACTASNPIGGECGLVKKSTVDGGIAQAILEREIQAGLQKDFISFGSLDCEDFICTRDPNFARNSNPDAPAKGYCTKPCANDTGCKTGDPNIDNVASKKLICRALLLDEATLGAICAANPADCKTYFGGATSPYFCARPLSADGGR